MAKPAKAVIPSDYKFEMRARSKALMPPEKEKALLDSGKLEYSHVDEIMSGRRGDDPTPPEVVLTKSDQEEMRSAIEDKRREAHAEFRKAGAKEGEDLSKQPEKVSTVIKTLRERHA